MAAKMAQATKEILVITSSTDATATYLCDKLVQKGVPFIRFDTEAFPSKLTLHWEIHPNSFATLSSDLQVIEMGRIGSVWYRRPSPPAISQEIIEPAAREFARRESGDALAALWQELKALWVNHPASIRFATCKPHQLRTACELGFNVPNTILSANQSQVRLFWEKHNGAVVFKSLHQDAIEVAGRNFFAYASRLTAEHLAELEKLTLAPVLFQNYIKPKLEVRVTVIGRQVFAASIDTPKTADEPDWRRIPPDKQNWEPHVLPASVEELCRQLVQRYGLHFGAIDLILTPQGEYYFLELNPNGQWAWIEMITEMPMSVAMIDLLSQNL